MRRSAVGSGAIRWCHWALFFFLLSVHGVAAWSTNLLPSTRSHGISAASSILPSVSRIQNLRSISLARAVNVRAVDLDDQHSIQELDAPDDAEDSTLAEVSLVQGLDSDAGELTQKILNAVFLMVSFGWGAYTVFNIDAGMTRGWTQSEIAMRIPLDNWSNYESSLMEKPIFTKTLINVVIYLLGDWLSQTVFQKKNVLDFDVSRTLKNGFIGLCFGPLVHQYYAFSDHILPVEGGLMNRVQKIFMDQTIYLTVKCSIYICAVGLLSGDDWDTCKQTVKDKIGKIVLTAWKFWPLVHCITYGVIPARHRILWVNSVDLIWNAILATQAQKEQPQEAVAEGTDGQTGFHDKFENADSFFFAENFSTPVKLVPAAEAPNETALNQSDVNIGLVVDVAPRVVGSKHDYTALAIANDTDTNVASQVLAEPEDKVAP